MKKKYILAFIITLLSLPIWSIQSFIKDGDYYVDGKKLDINNILNLYEGNITKTLLIDSKTQKLYLVIEPLQGEELNWHNTGILKIHQYDEDSSLFFKNYSEIRVSDFVKSIGFTIKDMYNGKLLLDCCDRRISPWKYYEIIIDIKSNKETICKIPSGDSSVIGFNNDNIFFDDKYYSLKNEKFIKYKYVLDYPRLDYSKQNLVGFLNGYVFIYEIETEKLITTGICPKRLDKYYYYSFSNNCFMNEDYLFIPEDISPGCCSYSRVKSTDANYGLYIYDRKTFKKIKKMKTQTTKAIIYK